MISKDDMIEVLREEADSLTGTVQRMATELNRLRKHRAKLWLEQRKIVAVIKTMQASAETLRAAATRPLSASNAMATGIETVCELVEAEIERETTNDAETQAG